MNRFLAESLNILNGMVAFLLVVTFTLGGHRLLPALPDPLALAIGAIIGIVIAAFICGMVAYVALIERHLGEIAKGMRGGVDQARPHPTQPQARQEPRI